MDSKPAEAKLNYIIQTEHVFVVDSHMPLLRTISNFQYTLTYLFRSFKLSRYAQWALSDDAV